MKHYMSTAWGIASFLFCVSTHSFCMELSIQKYAEEGKKNNQKYDRKLKKLIKHATDDNALEKINKIERKLQAHVQDVGHQKEIAFLAIKIKHNIGDSSWKVFIGIMQALQEFTEQRMRGSWENFTYDGAIPQWFVAMLKKQLVDVDINPQCITMCHNEKDSEIIDGLQKNWSYKNQILSMEIIGPGCISINSKDLGLDYLDVDALKGRAMLLAHIMKMYTSFDLLSILESCGVKIKDKEYSDFSVLGCRQAALTAALKNQRGAHCIKSLSDYGIKSYSSLELHKQLSSINFCWSALEWLKKYYSNNYHCIPLFFAAKNGDVSNVCSLLADGMVVTKKIVDEVNNDSPIKELLQKTHTEQKCCVCYEHPEDMRNMPCIGKHIKDFICRGCYGKLAHNELNEKLCPTCRAGCFSYNKITS